MHIVPDEDIGTLFDRHARAVYNHAFRLTGSWSLAGEIVQAMALFVNDRGFIVCTVNQIVRPIIGVRIQAGGGATGAPWDGTRHWLPGPVQVLMATNLPDRCWTGPTGQVLYPADEQKGPAAKCLPAEPWNH